MEQRRKSKLDVQENIYSILQEVLEQVNSWLHFAEAKNAALIAFNTAILGSLLTQLTNEKCVLSVKYLCVICGIMTIISTVVCLLSFFPNSKENSNQKRRREEPAKFNLGLYSHIAVLHENKYLIRLYKSYYNIVVNEEELNEREKNIESEIIANSKIAMRKYTLFKISLVIMVIAVMLFIGMFILEGVNILGSTK
ncbi:MAG: hypothetical protein IKL07_00140 [Clostridium sp.]|nr:hypothetical protein [Clostridium sp.]